jgi:tripartite ATP-independent transporter DctM subunit
MEKMKALYRIWGILVLFILVMGGMYGGIFTPNEAGAVGAFGCLVLGLINRRLKWKGFVESLAETGQLTGMIFILVIGAMIFNYFIAISKIPFSLANFITGLGVAPIGVVLIAVVVYIILGFFMEIIAVVMLTLPIIYPLLVAMGLDPIWFGVLVVLTVMIGQITPPVGVVVFAIGGLVKDVPLWSIFRGVWPFFYAMVIALVLLIVFPQISLWLPNLMRPF